MSHSILVTGATGAIGPLLLTELGKTGAFDKMFVLTRSTSPVDAAGCIDSVRGDIRLPDLGLEPLTRDRITHEVSVIVHAAANTRFTAASAELYNDNVMGTANVIRLAARCAGIRQFLLVSSTCVAGTRTGVIGERIENAEPDVVNPYERTKWLAEHVAAAAGVPLRIARLGICIGDAENGVVHRPGAIHQALRLLAAGYVPVVPGTAESRLDLISTNMAARWLARAATQPVDRIDVCHVAAGAGAIPLTDLLDAAVAAVGRNTARRLERPLVVDGAGYRLFERMIRRSGDLRFARVLDSLGSFLPILLYPKTYESARAEACWGGPLPLGDLRVGLENVTRFVLSRRSSCELTEESTHVRV